MFDFPFVASLSNHEGDTLQIIRSSTPFDGLRANGRRSDF
jgi:hypothetical protein